MPKKKSATPKKVFNAVIGKGTLWKSITELMTGDRITLHLSKEGMTIGHENKPLMSTKTEVCIIAKFSSENFDEYFCPKPFSVSFDTSEHNSFIKSSKKKVKLGIMISEPVSAAATPTGPRIYDLTLTVISPPAEGGIAPESSCGLFCHEENPTQWMAPNKEVYRIPVALPSSSFSQIKSFSNQESKKITIETQSHPKPYIGFFVDSGSTKKINKKFGRAEENVPVFYPDDEGYLYCAECEQYIGNDSDSCKCKCELCGSSRKECDCACPCGSSNLLKECGCGSNPYEVVNRIYPLGALLKLTKLSGMQLRFYEPKNPGPPLKIAFTAAYGGSVLGEVEVLINDMEEITKTKKK